MCNVRAAGLLAMLSLAGCASLAPRLPEPDPAIPIEWPLPATALEANVAVADVSGTTPATAATADIGWRDFFVDPALNELISRALANNRDLRTAALNIERARALYRIQRADLLPTLVVGASATRSGGDGAGTVPQVYSVSLGISAFELDFFGRVRDLSRAALQQYLAQEEVRRSVQLSLIAEVANVYLTLAVDQALLQVAEATLKSQSEAFRLTERRHELGAVSGLEVAQERTTVENARADAARFAGLVALDVNALQLVIGAPVERALWPKTFDTSVMGLAHLPAGLPSEVLLRRPDVLAAESRLRAANANIGAARAALFPSIRLTASAGTASEDLSGLFNSGSRFWSLSPQISLPIFDAGRLRANVDVATADQDIALSQYERTVQVGFREIADALALTRTLAAQREAQQALVEAATQAHELSLARYQAGRDSYLVQLVAQRTLFVAQQTLLSTRLAEQTNRVTLYKVLGGGWYEQSR